MKRKIGMIGFDLDGTVLNSRKEVTPRVRKALETAAEKGVVVLPATGRQLCGIPQEILSIPGIRYALASNGAHVYDLQTETPLFSDCFDKETTLQVLQQARQFDSLISLHIGGKGYVDMQCEKYLEATVPLEVLEYFMNSRSIVDSLEQLVNSTSQPIEKFSLMFRQQQERQHALDYFLTRQDVCPTSSMPQNLELNTATANKGDGLLKLAGMLCIPREEVMALGDGTNDLVMLQKVGLGVAMGNAVPELKAVADMVTLSCDEEGVASAIESFVLTGAESF